MLYQLTIDAIINITILAIFFLVEDTIIHKIGYIFIFILLWLVMRELNFDGVSPWTEYFKSLQKRPSNIIPLILPIISIPLIYLIIHATTTQQTIDYIIYGGLSLYIIFIFTIAILFKPKAYQFLLSFDDLFVQINNLIGKMTRTNVMPVYFSLFIPFLIGIYPMLSDIRIIKWVYISLLLMYASFIFYIIDYSI